MVSLLDCIERIPAVLEGILANRERNMQPLFDYLGDRINAVDQLVFIGSGTSNTAPITAAIFAEKASGLEVKVSVPSVFCGHTRVYRENALYVFLSQTGTSRLTRQAQKLVQEKGLLSVSVSESPDTPIAKEASCFLDMGCGYEEYPMRTIGYSATVFTLMLLGLEIGKRRGAITGAEYQDYIAQAAVVPDSLRKIPGMTLEWMKKSQWQMMRSQTIIFTGAGSLYGVALEGAVKTWETPKITSAGYELEEGMHGPNFGYNHNHCVITLNDGGSDTRKALALAGWMKDVYHNGLAVGAEVIDSNDLKIDLKGGEFSCLELAAVPQIISYKLALDQGRDLYAPHDNSVMNRYFSTHTKKGEDV